VKTILYSACYINPDNTSKLSISRIQRWVNYYSSIAKELFVDKIILIDDGSDPESLSKVLLPHRVFTKSLQPHLGRGDAFAHWGWWRSFTYGGIIAEEEGADRIISIETDAFVLTNKMAKYIRAVHDEWSTPWNNTLQWPETSFQIIGKNHFAWLKKHYSEGQDFWCKPRLEADCPEKTLPVTEINKDLIGDRYTEWGSQIPETADFACQVGNDFVPRGLV